MIKKVIKLTLNGLKILALDEKGRPYVEDSFGKTHYLSSADKEGRPQSPAKHSVAQGEGMVHTHGTKINTPKIKLPKIKIPKYKVKFNNSRHVPGFVKITKTN